MGETGEQVAGGGLGGEQRERFRVRPTGARGGVVVGQADQVGGHPRQLGGAVAVVHLRHDAQCVAVVEVPVRPREFGVAEPGEVVGEGAARRDAGEQVVEVVAVGLGLDPGGGRSSSRREPSAAASWPSLISRTVCSSPDHTRAASTTSCRRCARVPELVAQPPWPHAQSRSPVCAAAVAVAGRRAGLPSRFL
jgi:hypothetical protein